MTETIRLATPADSDALLVIYAPYVTDTVITFELEPPSSAEFEARVRTITALHPYLVHTIDGTITGFAYASPYHERAAYRYDASVSIYLRPEWHGKGIGKKLYTTLFALMRAQGFRTAYAGITLPNPKSVRIHEAFDFSPIGVYRKTGYKFGKWLDVIWMEKRLGDFDGDPGEIVPVGDLPEDAVRTLLASV